MAWGPLWHRVLLLREERTLENTPLLTVFPGTTERGVVMVGGRRWCFLLPAPRPCLCNISAVQQIHVQPHNQPLPAWAGSLEGCVLREES